MFRDAFDIYVSQIYIGIGCFVIYTPLCWVRRIEKFNVTHIIADIMILVTVIILIVYSILRIDKFGYPTQDYQFLNEATFLNVIGFAVYAYEGIGVVIPVMDITAKPE